MQLKKFTPPRMLAISFLVMILLGTVLLSLPWSVQGGKPDLLTSLFTATSAVCVTGLVVVDTGTYWSMWGQLIILLLIQVGGLGIMSFATLFALILGRKIQLSQRLIMQQAINKPSMEGVVNIFRYLLIFSFTAEAVGAVLLISYWIPSMGVKDAIWKGIFHSVSAFNNAGFDIMGNFTSLTGYAGSTYINLVISGLFILSGLGFFVVYEISNYKKNRRLSLHSRIVIVSTLFLIISGTLLIFFTEYNNALNSLSMENKLTASFFQAVTSRTAGFNTIDMNSLSQASLLLIMFFMFIGGSPGSTAGGVKTVTFTLLLISTYSFLRGRRETEIAGRRIATHDIYRALAITLPAFFLIFIMTFMISLTHSAEFLKILFEVVSAMGTVGLSLGLTTEMNKIGELLIIITMFLGRLGPLTIGYALARKIKQPEVRYPEEKLMLG